MSTHRLAPQTAGARSETEHQPADSTDTERAVLQVLGGTSLNEAAAAEQVELADLAEAVEIYRQAGRRALERQQASGWWQVYIQFSDWNTSEQVAADTIVPMLKRAEESGLVSNWWFMRKYPCWRLRLHPNTNGQAMRDHLTVAFDQAAGDGRISRWWNGIYEAETAAFGGGDCMVTAHELFCEDSRAVMRLVRDGAVGLGRRELSLLLCSTLMRAAGLEWYEQGDIWHRVAQERLLPDDVPLAKLTGMANDLKQLMVADTTADGPLLSADGPLASVTVWADAFRKAGRALGEATRAGTMERGLREVLSYLVIFHWNRLGLPARTQSILAWAARAAIVDLPARSASGTTADERLSSAPRSTSSTHASQSVVEGTIVRFPLVPQRRFRCPELETQVLNVRDCANSCRDAITTDERINRACTVWNLSALIAADCGLPDAAIDLCQRQFQVFRGAAPVSGTAAIASLQPLINLARMTRRHGDPEGAYRQFEAIGKAVHSGGTVLIHGVSIDFDGLIDGDMSIVDAWIRDVMRDEGTRSLVAAGQWARAAAHAEKYDHNRERLREGRQTRIIAHALNEQSASAIDLINNAVTTEAWEEAVAACLRGFVRLKDQSPSAAAVVELLDTVRRARAVSDRPTMLFRVRLGLAATELAAAAQADAQLLISELLEEAERSEDAFIAREILAVRDCRAQATPTQMQALTMLVERAGLGAGRISEPLQQDLRSSIATAESVLAKALGDSAAS